MSDKMSDNVSDNEEIIHKKVCAKAKKACDLITWIQYGCKNCKRKLRKAEKKYNEICDIARRSNIDEEGSERIKEEKRVSEELHGTGMYHPLISKMFMDEIKNREIEKIKNKDLKDKVKMFLYREQRIHSDVWSRF